MRTVVGKYRKIRLLARWLRMAREATTAKAAAALRIWKDVRLVHLVAYGIPSVSFLAGVASQEWPRTAMAVIFVVWTVNGVVVGILEGDKNQSGKVERGQR